MVEFKESKFYKLLQDFFINNDKETFLQMLGEFYNRTEVIINKNEIQDDLIKELRELYLEFNEKGIDDNIVREKVNYFVENNEKIQDIILKIIRNKNNIENITLQLDKFENETFIKNRKIDYLFSATPWQFSYDGGMHPSRPEQITAQLEKMKYLGFDGIVVIATLVKDDNDNIDFDIPLSSILWYITETKRLNMSVRAIKVHMKDEYFSTIDNIEKKYRNKVMQLANAAKDYGIPYFVVYNEAVNYLYNANSFSIQSITSLCDSIRNLGFKVGISGISFKKICELEWLNDCQDVMLPFAYTRISYKGKNTTIADSLFAYKEQLKEYAHYKEKINKPIIISETGILPYWGAFANPVYFDWNDYEPIDNSGEIQKIFFYGLFETVEFNDIIDECWVWFPDNMTDGDALENCSKFIKRYTQGVK